MLSVVLDPTTSPAPNSDAGSDVSTGRGRHLPREWCFPHMLNRAGSSATPSRASSAGRPSATAPRLSACSTHAVACPARCVTGSCLSRSVVPHRSSLPWLLLFSLLCFSGVVIMGPRISHLVPCSLSIRRTILSYLSPTVCFGRRDRLNFFMVPAAAASTGCCPADAKLRVRAAAA